MNPSSRVSVLIGMILSSLLLVWGLFRLVAQSPVAFAQNNPPLVEPTPLPEQPIAVQSPDISFIESPTPSCVLPRPGTNACYIVWQYLYAAADPAYMITMTVEIDGQSRARYHGFFQTSMYVPSEMLVFGVTCGGPGAGGDPQWGSLYPYTLRGRDSNDLKAANYGQVYCPADEIKTFIPLIRK